MKSRLSFFILITLLLATASTVFAESEPNDTFATADPLGIGLSNAEVGNTLTTDDYDYFYFTAVAGRTYVIETYNIQGSGSNATGLWLYNDSQTEITHDGYGQYGTGNANARIVYTFSTTGTYYVLVKDEYNINWTGTYSLRILPKYDEPDAEWNPTYDDEPNDVKELANMIEVGLENAQTHQLFNHSSYVTNDSDHDFYHFEAEAGHTYVIETYDIQGTGTNATGLWLYDSSGTLITHDGYGQSGTGNANARIVYTFSTSGTYFVLVKDEWNINWTGSYSLRILPRFDEPGADWDASNDNEPNDARELANEVEIGLSSAQTHQLFNNNNYITNDSDYDWYWFTAVAGNTYVIETYNIQGTGGNATGLWLYDNSGTLITHDGYGQSGTGNANARIVYTFATSGTYFVLVKDEWNIAWTGTYSLRILPKYDEPGAEWNSSNDYEPNEVLPLAYALGVGAENAQTHQLFNHAVYVTNNSDHDFYRFHADAGTYIIQTFGIQASGRATGLWLYNATGTALTNDQYGDAQTGTAEIEFTFLTAGDYFILVKDAHSVGWTGTYSVRVCEDSCLQSVYLPMIVR